MGREKKTQKKTEKTERINQQGEKKWTLSMQKRLIPSAE